LTIDEWLATAPETANPALQGTSDPEDRASVALPVSVCAAAAVVVTALGLVKYAQRRKQRKAVSTYEAGRLGGAEQEMRRAQYLCSHPNFLFEPDPERLGRGFPLVSSTLL
jgi:hypothetical protein